MSAMGDSYNEKQCKGSLRTALVGDGCEVCNPALAQELAFMAASDKAAEYRSMCERLAEALQCVGHNEVCWCGVAIGNPMYKEHSTACKRATAALAAYNELKERGE